VTSTVLLTGAAGEIGTMLRDGLARDDRRLRLVDAAELPPPRSDQAAEVVQASVTDAEAMRVALQGVDAVVHLAGLLRGHAWEDYLDVNVHGTYVVLEQARLAGVNRVVLASSNHAVGFHPRSEQMVPDYLYPRPDSLYGVAKVAAEALGSLYHDRHGMDVVCLRIGSYRTVPADGRALAMWLSPADCVNLIDAALTTPSPGFRIVWAVSDNTRNRLSLEEARSIGYEPQDDAEAYADTLDTDDPGGVYDDALLGGAFFQCDPGCPDVNLGAIRSRPAGRSQVGVPGEHGR
jgi:uronate dehydrogenase